ncbi:hypothetical protein ACWEHA_29355 [Amycolatopsis nivea]
MPVARRVLVLEWLVREPVSPNRVAAVLVARALAGAALVTRPLVATWLARAVTRQRAELALGPVRLPTMRVMRAAVVGWLARAVVRQRTELALGTARLSTVRVMRAVAVN